MPKEKEPRKKLTNITPVSDDEDDLNNASSKLKNDDKKVEQKKDSQINENLPDIVNPETKETEKPKRTKKPVSAETKAKRSAAGKKGAAKRKKNMDKLKEIEKQMNGRLNDDELIEKISDRLFEKMSALNQGIISEKKKTQKPKSPAKPAKSVKPKPRNNISKQVQEIRKSMNQPKKEPKKETALERRKRLRGQ